MEGDEKALFRYARIFWGSARRRHKDKGFPDETLISVERYVELMLPMRCEATGVSLFVAEKRRLYTPSFDRIDSSRGYEEGNVRVVCLAYNMMKNDASDEEAKEFLLRAATAIQKGEDQ
jgi:hypothetical protein